MPTATAGLDVRSRSRTPPAGSRTWWRSRSRPRSLSAQGAATGVLGGATLVAALVTLGYALAQVAALWLVVRHPRHLRRVVDGARVAWARLRRRRPTPVGPGDFDDLTAVLAALRANPCAAMPTLVSACVAKLAGVATLVLVVVGLGLAIDPVSIAVIFVLGLAAAMLGPLPGGLGTTEVSLAALLGTAGVAAGVATGVVVAFRLFDFWLPTILGLTVSACTSRRTRMLPASVGNDASLEVVGAGGS